MHHDIVIIGAGIAGLSAASELARLRGTGRGICVLEAENAVAQHTSARSAQQLIPSYGPEPVLELTRWSIAALAEASADLPSPLVWPSPFVVAGSPADVAAETVPGLRRMSGTDLFALCPELRADAARYRTAAVDGAAVRSDATALLAWHRRRAESAGVAVRTGFRVTGARRAGSTWELLPAATSPGTEPDDVVRAGTVVNAAGAWAEHVGSLLGGAPQGLQPLRRTAALVRLDTAMPAEHPMVMDAAEHWYYRPDPVGAMISVGESEPSEACDAQPHPGAVERLIATIHEHTELRITGVAKAWTGLRTERASDVPVCGWDPAADGVFWLAGQGGYGFQTSAAMAAAAAEQIVTGGVGGWLTPETVAALQPERAA
ncbi:NAD(P)/FAD-dependent oxidoreductase [Kocuria tytonis]|uniref:FAD-binding oxidoreductase n=1 Tax=Kocuria tytonis TaxID=2054280 RepID=A0A495A533_9MICC|nr:FAD-dependent oxidoreductase [Kocuria tytonis]RKQ34203.1 FAD-binding oxidoreductase [Kocuria tytonis]